MEVMIESNVIFYVINDYEHGGLRMFYLHLFSHAQKSIWVKQLLDPGYYPGGGTRNFCLDGGVPPGPRDPNPCLE